MFSQDELERLKLRVEELDQEKADLRLHHKTLKKEHLDLLRDRKASPGRPSLYPFKPFSDLAAIQNTYRQRRRRSRS